MEAINKIAKENNLYVIEDAAQSFGGSYKQKKSCALSDFATSSFFPTKPLGAYGDGGAIFTDNDNFAKIINSLRSHGAEGCFESSMNNLMLDPPSVIQTFIVG